MQRLDIFGRADIVLLFVVWGTDPGGPPDFDGDGSVGTSDLLALLANWGPCPKRSASESCDLKVRNLLSSSLQATRFTGRGNLE